MQKLPENILSLIQSRFFFPRSIDMSEKQPAHNFKALKFPENNIGAIHNWHEKPIWEHYQIIGGKAKKISIDAWSDLYNKRKTIGIEVNQPLYVED